MSFIIGVNLSDRIYLAADTRITRKDPTGGLLHCEDNFLKIESLSGRVAVAAAGNAKFASYLIKEIERSGAAEGSIRTLRQCADDALRTLADQYFASEYADCVLIFGGTNPNKKKEIPFKRYYEILNSYQKIAGGKSMEMKEAVFQGIFANGDGSPPPILTLPTSDSHVFAVTITPRTFKIEDVDWGDYIAYGAGMTKANVPSSALGDLEFADREKELKYARAYLAIFIKGTAESFAATTVGGSVVSYIINEDGVGVLTGGVARVDVKTGEEDKYYSHISLKEGVIYRKTANGLIPLRSLKGFYPKGDHGDFNI